MASAVTSEMDFLWNDKFMIKFGAMGTNGNWIHTKEFYACNLFYKQWFEPNEELNRDVPHKFRPMRNL